MLDALKKIINPAVVIEIESTNESQSTGKKKIIVTESHPQSKLNKLCIKGILDNSFAFTLDYKPKKSGIENKMYKQLSPYVNEENGEGVNKSCDLVLFYVDKGNKCTVLLFDLKSTKPKSVDVKKQLKNSEIYVEYILSMAAHYYHVDTSNIIYKQAIVTTEGRAMNTGSVYQKNKKKNKQIFGDINVITVPYPGRNNNVEVEFGKLQR